MGTERDEDEEEHLYGSWPPENMPVSLPSAEYQYSSSMTDVSPSDIPCPYSTGDFNSQFDSYYQHLNMALEPGPPTDELPIDFLESSIYGEEVTIPMMLPTPPEVPDLIMAEERNLTMSEQPGVTMPSLSKSPNSTILPELIMAENEEKKRELTMQEDFLSKTSNLTILPELIMAENMTEKPFLSKTSNSTILPELIMAENLSENRDLTMQEPFLSKTSNSTILPELIIAENLSENRDLTMQEPFQEIFSPKSTNSTIIPDCPLIASSAETTAQSKNHSCSTAFDVPSSAKQEFLPCSTDLDMTLSAKQAIFSFFDQLPKTELEHLPEGEEFKNIEEFSLENFLLEDDIPNLQAASPVSVYDSSTSSSSGVYMSSTEQEIQPQTATPHETPTIRRKSPRKVRKRGAKKIPELDEKPKRKIPELDEKPKRTRRGRKPKKPVPPTRPSGKNMSLMKQVFETKSKSGDSGAEMNNCDSQKRKRDRFRYKEVYTDSESEVESEVDVIGCSDEDPIKAELSPLESMLIDEEEDEEDCDEGTSEGREYESEGCTYIHDDVERVVAEFEALTRKEEEQMRKKEEERRRCINERRKEEEQLRKKEEEQLRKKEEERRRCIKERVEKEKNCQKDKLKREEIPNKQTINHKRPSPNLHKMEKTNNFDDKRPNNQRISEIKDKRLPPKVERLNNKKTAEMDKVEPPNKHKKSMERPSNQVIVNGKVEPANKQKKPIERPSYQLVAEIVNGTVEPSNKPKKPIERLGYQRVAEIVNGTVEPPNKRRKLNGTEDKRSSPELNKQKAMENTNKHPSSQPSTSRSTQEQKDRKTGSDSDSNKPKKRPVGTIKNKEISNDLIEKIQKKQEDYKKRKSVAVIEPMPAKKPKPSKPPVKKELSAEAKRRMQISQSIIHINHDHGYTIPCENDPNSSSATTPTAEEAQGNPALATVPTAKEGQVSPVVASLPIVEEIQLSPLVPPTPEKSNTVNSPLVASTSRGIKQEISKNVSSPLVPSTSRSIKQEISKNVSSPMVPSTSRGIKQEISKIVSSPLVPSTSRGIKQEISKIMSSPLVPSTPRGIKQEISKTVNIPLVPSTSRGIKLEMSKIMNSHLVPSTSRGILPQKSKTVNQIEMRNGETMEVQTLQNGSGVQFLQLTSIKLSPTNQTRPAIVEPKPKAMISLLKSNNLPGKTLEQQKKKIGIEEYYKSRKMVSVSSSTQTSAKQSPQQPTKPSVTEYKEKISKLAQGVLSYKKSSKSRAPSLPDIDIIGPKEVVVVSKSVPTTPVHKLSPKSPESPLPMKLSPKSPMSPPQRPIIKVSFGVNTVESYSIKEYHEMFSLLGKSAKRLDNNSLVFSIIDEVYKKKVDASVASPDNEEHWENKTICYQTNEKPVATCSVEVQTEYTCFSTADGWNSLGYTIPFPPFPGSRSQSRSNSPSPSTSTGRSRRRSRTRSRSPSPNRERLIESEERRVVYVGKLSPETTREDLERRFKSFGQITRVSVHHKRGVRFGFVTFKLAEDAYRAKEHGNDDPNYPPVELNFGGRRDFCLGDWLDLDRAQQHTENDNYNYHPPRPEDQSYEWMLDEYVRLRRSPS